MVNEISFQDSQSLCVEERGPFTCTPAPSHTEGAVVATAVAVYPQILWRFSLENKMEAGWGQEEFGKGLLFSGRVPPPPEPWEG